MVIRLLSAEKQQGLILPR